MENPLKSEFEFYLAHQGEFVNQYNGKVVVLKGHAVIGVYDDQATAVFETQKTEELGTFRELKAECGVCAAYDPSAVPDAARPPFHRFTGLWDTGATSGVITQRVVDLCGLRPFTMQTVKGAYGDATERNVYLVNIGLPNGLAVPNVTVVLGEPHGTDVLIGMDIITLGDFAVTNENGESVFTFRIPSLHTIDYVKQATQIRDSREHPVPSVKKKRK